MEFSVQLVDGTYVDDNLCELSQVNLVCGNVLAITVTVFDGGDSANLSGSLELGLGPVTGALVTATLTSSDGGHTFTGSLNLNNTGLKNDLATADYKAYYLETRQHFDGWRQTIAQRAVTVWNYIIPLGS